MSKTVISVEHLTKRYDLGVINTGTLSKDMSRWWANLHGKPDPCQKIGETEYGNRKGDSLLALEDVSFQVQQGEALGIIGRNGAGKSTLLKILSRVTAPTSGKVKMNGRVGSLLEVGTGFHPELTGRENIYLNGAIMGMSRAEVGKKFDEIVDFSGVEKFINTPVKRYSSGMYVRLAFAVAAHLESEILIVDEVLAVGDAEFQKKCMGKMGSVASEGRTVLYVSHNMPSIIHLCERAIVLDSGRIFSEGPATEIVTKYINQTKDKLQLNDLGYRKDRTGNQNLRFLSYRILNSNKEKVNSIRSGEDVTFAIDYKLTDKVSIKDIVVAITVFGPSGEPMFHLSNKNGQFTPKTIPENGTFYFHLPSLPLQPGVYFFALFCMINGVISDWFTTAGKIEVDFGDFYGTGFLSSPEQGPYLIPQDFYLEKK